MNAWETAGAIVGSITAFLAFVGALCAAAVKGVRAARRMTRFLDQWFGHGEGVERVPGVLERVSQLDARGRRVEGQVFPNGGSSLRDTVEVIHGQLAEHLVASAINLERFDAIERKLDGGGTHG